VQLGCIQLIAADEINAEALTDQRGGHAKRISPVVPAGKKTDANRSRGAASRPSTARSLPRRTRDRCEAAVDTVESCSTDIVSRNNSLRKESARMDLPA
jgi:hypothetical protein